MYVCKYKNVILKIYKNVFLAVHFCKKRFLTMRFKFNINGSLWEDMLDHVALISYDHLPGEDVWVALTRSYRKDGQRAFTEYRMDDTGVFRAICKTDGREPIVLRQYRSRNGIRPGRGLALPSAPRTKYVWAPRMTRKAWEIANGLRPKDSE